ncbi:MAG: hypothetical protein RLZZ623_699 [Actinomycetota bacterium]
MGTQINKLDALRESVRRLPHIVGPLDDHVIAEPAYPTDWTIAQVMSHLGSGAVILNGRLDDALAGAATADEFAPQTWDAWNAKSPRSQVDDALVADAAFLAALEGLTDAERGAFSFSLGPMTFDIDGFIGLRLNEHALHTWDIEVALEPTATVPASIVEAVVDNLDLAARFSARATDGGPATVTIRTTDPERRFIVAFTADGATLESSTGTTGVIDLELSAESFARLVYGRLDVAHTPSFTGDPAVIDRLRATFPGM